MDVLVRTSVPASGLLSLRLAIDVQINVSDVDAQRHVSKYVHGEISSQMHGGKPVLMLGESFVWRVPIHLTFPSIGDAGVVGYIEVDVNSGALNTLPDVIREIERNAENLARRVARAAAG